MTTVLVTGAAGSIGTALRERLPGYGWDVRSFDREPVPDGSVGDITSPADLDAALAGVSAVVHLAGQPSEAPWPVIRDANIEGTFQVFEAARRAGVHRVVYASSVHAVGFVPTATAHPADLPPRPDTLYGVSKAFGEALARYYVDRYGFAVACLRIGTFEPRPTHGSALSTWLSPDDCARLVDACLRAPELTYALVWGVSCNSRQVLSADAGRALGYEPQDDAEAFADQVADTRDPSAALLGGGFTSVGFGIDEVGARW
jgi:uronate dehydrogenase